MREPMVLGYLTNQYGRESDTFVRTEVRQLRELGHTVRTGGERERAVSAEVRGEQAATEYVLEAGPLWLGLALVACAFRRPRRMARALRLAWRTHAPGPQGALWQLFYLAEAAYLARRFESLRIEHVHNHIAMNSATVCMLAAVLFGVSWSMTVHGPHDFLEQLRWALPEMMEAAAFIIFVAEFGRSQGRGSHRPLPGRLHDVRCGQGESFQAGAPTPIPPAPRILFVGRLSPEKGVVLLVEAVAKLRGEGIRVDLVLIGDGPSRRDVEQTVARHGLTDAVTLLGWCSSTRVREEILASRALVLPSFAEGLPIVLLEAFALHRPVVSTYVGGIPELEQPGRNGFLVSAVPSKELAEAMRTVVTASADELAEMGRRGAACVAALHDSAENVRRLEALLWGVAQGCRKAALVGAR